jgi:glycine oxidase
MDRPEICIAGAGIIGLSLALELNHRGATVAVYERGIPTAQATTAAAGMLAAEDPKNPLELRALADLSLSLYPGYLAQIESLAGEAVPFQTSTTLEASRQSQAISSGQVQALLPQLVPGSHRFVRLEEHSLDPRQLAQALLAAVRARRIPVHTDSPVLEVRSQKDGVEVFTPSECVAAKRFIDCTGAWAGVSAELPPQTIAPRKGQLLALELPASLPLDIVVRAPEIYIVPRTKGPNAGRAIIGATIEDKGFDTSVNPEDIARLHARAAMLLPALASARVLESWAGLRPATADGLPLLGALPGRPNHLIAAGHYRNGILLAPATAVVLADLIAEATPMVDVERFSPERFAGASRH